MEKILRDKYAVFCGFQGGNIFITNCYGENHDSRIYMNSDNIQKYIKRLPQDFHILGNVAFRDITNIKVAENYERMHLNIFENIKNRE